MTISLCAVVRNEARRLPAMLESVRGLVSEVVLLDNASTDGTVEVTRAWGEQNGVPVRVEREAEVRGYPDWIYNRCLSRAGGEYTLLLDGDEVLTPFGRDRLPGLMQNSEVEVWALSRLAVVEGSSPTYHFEHHVRFGKTGKFGYPEGDCGPHQPPRAIQATCNHTPWPQPMFTQTRSGREQLARDKARGQYPDVRLPDVWETIPGWTDFQAIYDLAVECADDGAVFVEVGSWLGRSTAYLAQTIVESQKSITLYAVDHFGGTPGEQPHTDVIAAYGGTIFPQFVRNMDLGDYLRVVRPLPITSAQAAQVFAPGTVDFVFLDAQHTHEAVTADIRRWRPAIKPGGLIGGHDWSEAWPGVIAATDEVFGRGNYDVSYCPGSWLVRL